jgi:hypothetical protein
VAPLRVGLALLVIGERRRGSEVEEGERRGREEVNFRLAERAVLSKGGM